MKRFRSLVIATAAICSFQSFAGVISFNWDPAKHESSFERDYSDETTRDPRTTVQADMLPVSISLNAEVELGSVKFDSGIRSTGSTTLRVIGFDSSHQFVDPLLNQQELCSYTHFNKTDCDMTGARSLESVFSISMYKYSSHYGLSVTHSTSFSIKNTEKYNENAYIKNFREYNSALSHSYHFDANAPQWLQNLQAPSVDELRILSASSWMESQFSESYQLFTMLCDVSGTNCPNYSSNVYYRNLIGTAEWQTETVPLPTTASFLLLGVAGLALRRRLTA